MTKAKNPGTRPYTTDYGVTKGYCATPQGAIRSALKHMMTYGGHHCTIERKNGPPIDVWYTGVWGVQVSIRKAKAQVINLRRVK